MRILGASLKARYLEKLGLPNEFPEGGYMYDIAQGMIDEAGEGFKDADLDVFRKRAQRRFLPTLTRRSSVSASASTRTTTSTTFTKKG